MHRFVVERAMNRLRIALALGIAGAAIVAAPAAAGPTATVCASIGVTVNGESVVDESRCEQIAERATSRVP